MSLGFFQQLNYNLSLHFTPGLQSAFYTDRLNYFFSGMALIYFHLLLHVGSSPIRELTDNENVTTRTLSEFPETLKG